MSSKQEAPDNRDMNQHKKMAEGRNPPVPAIPYPGRSDSQKPK